MHDFNLICRSFFIKRCHVLGLNMVIHTDACMDKPLYDWLGITVTVHHPHVDGIPEQSGIFLSPGSINRLLLAKVSCYLYLHFCK